MTIKCTAQRRDCYTCSWTSSCGEHRSRINIGTAPSSMTTRVWADVPDAILVNAHAASNCNKHYDDNYFTEWPITLEAGWPLSRHCEIHWQFTALLYILSGTHIITLLVGHRSYMIFSHENRRSSYEQESNVNFDLAIFQKMQTPQLP